MADNIRVLERIEPARMRADMAREVAEGLSAPRKRLASRFFYDTEGSRIFQEIMDSPEYYLTDCEREILTARRERIAQLAAGEPFRLVELGAGDGRKTDILLECFQREGLDFEYTPIDISEGAMVGLVQDVLERYPDLPTQGLVCEYNHGLETLKREAPRRNFVLFLGSSIGNFTSEQADEFCASLSAVLNPGDLALVGFDLRKDPHILIPAYSDSRGVTARFNMNLLRRLNQELDADFDLDAFMHHATYDPWLGTMESYLLSCKAQRVSVGALDRSFDFRAWEAIHMEYSWKYLPEEIQKMASRNNFETVAMLYDERGYFCDAVWRVRD